MQTTPALRRPVRLVLALVLACGAALAGTAAAAPGTAPAQPGVAPHLELIPAAAVVQLDHAIRYTVIAVDAKGGRSDVTASTTFRFRDAAPCSQVEGKIGEVICHREGVYHLTGEIDVPRLTSDPVELEVTYDPVQPRIDSIDPLASPPNREVVVTGTTGTCRPTGRLLLDEDERSAVEVIGTFTAKLRIPPGTVPGEHLVWLRVRCGTDIQDANSGLMVENQPPTPADDNATTIPGEPVTIHVTRNDKDPDDPDGYPTLVREATPGPSRGRIEVLDKDQTIVYTPGEGFDRRGDQFDYAYCDVIGPDDRTACGTATVTVTRTPPTPVPDAARTEQDLEVLIPVTDNDKLPDKDALHVSRPPDQPQATAMVDADHPGSIRYKPAERFTGTDTFAYDYCPVGVNAAAAGACPDATVTVTVEPPSVDPRIDSVDPDPTSSNSEVVVKGTTGSCDKAARLTLDSQPDPAVPVPVAGGQDGDFEARLKVPAGTYVGADKLQLHVVCDGEPEVVEDELKVANQRPDAVDDQAAIATTPRASVPIKVLANDRDPNDPDGYEVRVAVERDPAHGTTDVQRDQTISYTPGQGFADVGEDQFIYRYCDVVSAAGQTDCDTATVRVTKLPPEPVDDPGITTVRDRAVVIDVMGNDRNVGKTDIAKLQVKREPAPRGEPRPRSDGKIEYRPEQGFTGTDTFQYDYCGGPVVVNAAQACPPATVTVTVTVERLPVPPRIDSVDRNPSPPNREVVVKGATGSCDKAATLTLDSAPRPARPVPLTGGRDGGFEAKLQVPTGTFVGAYRLQLHVVCDGKPEAVERELKVANQAPRAADDPATTTMDTAVTIDVTGNDVDPDGDDGYRTSLDPGRPEHGTAVEQQPGNRIRYTPASGFTGEDRFSYRFCDLVDADRTPDCGAATVIVTVDKLPPHAVDDAARTLRDHPLTIQVTSNDLHPDPAKLHVSRPPTPPATAVEQRQPPGSIRYTPAPGFTGTDTFQYDYCGGSVVVNAAGRAACTPATVTVTVAKPDPVPVDDADVTTVAGQPVVVDVMGNDRDPDPSRLRLRPDPPSRGRPEPLPDGRVRYTPEPGQAGTDTFRYDYCRGAEAAAQAACPFATVTVTVTADPVIASVRPGSSPPGRTVEVAGNTGSCAQAGTLTLQGTGAAVGVAGDRNGGFTAGLAVPAGTFPGAYRLELRVDCGGQARRAEATLTVTNRAPVAVDDADTTTRDHPVTTRVTRNDRDPDDPDGYENLVLVTSPPAQGTAEVQPDQTILYSPASGFVGEDRIGYSLCDNVLNAARAADCGAATVTVTVTDTPVISSVTPGSTPPGQPVQVVGNTGSCSRAGTLIFHGPVDLPLAVSAEENGRFATALTVPAGTFPQPYRLELRVDCGGQIQQAETILTVTNQAPVAVDDPATTTPDTPVTIDVTANDRDRDDPDGYENLVLVTSPPAHGTAEVQPDQTILYSPASGFVGEDRIGYSLCDNVLNAASAADCGAATVTVTVSAVACLPVGGPPRLELEPGKGPGGTRLRITAAVDRRLAACPLRFFLGGTPLSPDVRVGGDGSISADLRVPKKVKRGRSSLRLATMSAQTLAERPFEVVGGPIPWPLRLALGAGALLVGALARTAFRRWRTSQDQPSRPRPTELPDNVRAEPHTRPVEVGVEPVPDGTRTFAVRLQPHADPGTQTLQEG